MLHILKTLGYLSEFTGRLIAPFTILMLLLTSVVVICRYVLDIGAIQFQESVTYLHAMVFMLGIPYTLKHEGHVRVDIVYQKLSCRHQAMVNVLGILLFLFPMAGFILWSSLDFVAFSWQLREVSAEPGGLPYVYLLKTLIPIMAGLLIIQGCADLSEQVTRLRQDQGSGNHLG